MKQLSVVVQHGANNEISHFVCVCVYTCCDQLTCAATQIIVDLASLIQQDVSRYFTSHKTDFLSDIVKLVNN